MAVVNEATKLSESIVSYDIVFTPEDLVEAMQRFAPPAPAGDSSPDQAVEV